MTSTRRRSVTTGVLFLVATGAAVAAAALLPDLSGPGYLADVADRSDQVTAYALLYLVAAGTSVGVAISLYPLLRDFDAALALGSVVFRTIEAVFYTVGVVAVLSVLSLAEQPAAATATGAAGTKALADSLLSVRQHASLVAVFAFTAGALMYYLVFVHSRLVPRWLSVFGVVAVLLMAVACLLALFSNGDVTDHKLLAAPLFVQELVLAVWLLVKGFNPARLPLRASSDSPSGATETPVGRR